MSNSICCERGWKASILSHNRFTSFNTVCEWYREREPEIKTEISPLWLSIVKHVLWAVYGFHTMGFAYCFGSSVACQRAYVLLRERKGFILHHLYCVAAPGAVGASHFSLSISLSLERAWDGTMIISVILNSPRNIQEMFWINGF